MEDPEAIVYLEPTSKDAIAIANLPENNQRLMKLPPNPRQASLLRDSQIAALQQYLNPLLPDPAIEEAITREATPCDEDDRILIRLGFDIEPRNGSLGFVFGRASSTAQTRVLPDVVFPNRPDNPDPDISRAHFRIHYNLSSGVLMITDSSMNGTIVGRSLLRRRSAPLMTTTTVCCGTRDRYRFQVHIPDHTKHQDLYHHNYRRFTQKLGCTPCVYLPTPTPAHQPIPLGHDYSIFEGICNGGFGAVNTVIRNRDGLVFAAKTIAGQAESGQTTFPEEVKIMRKLSHPHVVEFVDAFFWNNCVQLVMERLSMDLDDYRKSRPNHRLSLVCTRSVARQSLSGLAYLHAQGITHRDVKPKNILVAALDDATNLPIIKLADFGLSSQQPELKTFCGTPYYVAPEVHETRRLNNVIRHQQYYYGHEYVHQHTYTPAVDIWAAGMVFHGLLGGKFKHVDKEGQIWHPEWRVFGIKQKPAAELITRMLNVEPEKRPTASNCLLDPWLAEDVDVVRQPQNKRTRSSSPLTQGASQPLKRVLR